MANLNDAIKAANHEKKQGYPALRQIGRGERGLRFSVKPGTLNKSTLDATFVGTNGEETKGNLCDYVFAPVSDAWARSSRGSSSGSSSSGMTREEQTAAEKELTGK